VSLTPVWKLGAMKLTKLKAPCFSIRWASLWHPLRPALKKKAAISGRPIHNRVRLELLIPIDGATEVQTNAELEEVQDAREQKVRGTRHQRLLGEDRHPACLDLD